MRFPTGILVLALTFLVAGFVAAAGDDPTVGELSGDAFVVSGEEGEPKALASGDSLKEGDQVILAEGAKMKVALPEGASMEVSGPADFGLRMVAEFVWSIGLKSGSIDHLVAKDYFTGVTVPGDIFLVLRKGDVSVAVDGGRVSVTVNEGDQTKVVQGKDGEARKLAEGETFVFEGEAPGAAAEEPAEPEPAEAPEEKPALGATIRIGDHLVRVVPKDSFTIAQTPGGGWVLTCRAPEGEYCQVTMDGDVNFFLTSGESIEFDSKGNIVRHDAVVHVYAALDYRGIFNDAVANPSDTSFVGDTSE